MISLVNVAKEYGGRVLFSGVSLTIGSSERIGLVGPNGSGKTTLLEILAGRIEPSEGDVSVNRRATVGYLKQEVPAAGKRTLMEEMLAGHEHLDRLSHRLALIEEEMRGTEDPADLERLAAEHGELERRFDLGGGYDLPSEAKRILGGLAFRETDLHRPVSHFSGGWLMRLSLGRLLLLEPDLLLLDEPTNYLDLDSVVWLEGYLREYAGSMVVVSHDRVLLNTLSERVLEIDGEKVVAYEGNYDAYRKARALREEGLQAARKAQERKIAKTQAFIDRFRAKNTLARRVQSRIKQLEKMEEIHLAQDQKKMRLAFPDPPRAGRVLIELEGVEKSYGSIRVYAGVDLRIERGERIVLVGPNGAGKSTLLKILAGVLPVDAGERRLGHNVRTAYYAQHQIEALDYGRTVFDEVREAAPGLTDQEIRNLLGRFLFSGDDVFKRIEVLSGGEKARVALAKLLLHPPNLLLLDEPTSHLDMSARDVLADALSEYSGSLVMISHDRHFIDRLANRVLEVGGGGIRTYLGTYSEYLERKRAEREEESPRGSPLPGGEEEIAKKEGPRKGKGERRREAEERNRRYRVLRPVKEELGLLEKEIETLEGEAAGLEERMASTEFYEERSRFEETFREYRKLQAEIGAKTERWEELSERLEALERDLSAELPDRERA